MFGASFGAKFVVVSLLFTSLLAAATPAEVLIIRHGEKPSTADSDSDDQDLGQDLSARGYERAAALPRLFTLDQRFLDYGTPVAIYAGGPKHPDRSSLRPQETVAPTAKALGLQVNTSFRSKDYDDMVDEVLAKKAYDGKTVLVSWPHDQLEDMARLFGVKKSEIPKWKGKTFDRVWKIRFDRDGNVMSFENLPQSLLVGDSAQ